jgi:hypothetical protein
VDIVTGVVSISEERKVCTGSEKFFRMCESNEVRGERERKRETERERESESESERERERERETGDTRLLDTKQ